MLTVLATIVAMASATTLPATNITNTSATLNGTVEGATTARFQYATSTDPPFLVTPVQTVSDGPVSATVGDLSPNTTYHYRIVSDADTGDFVSFRTAPNPSPPGVADQLASAITDAGAQLRGSVDPNGAETNYYFQYGRSTGYGNRTARVTVPAGADPVPVTAKIGGLRPYTRYHWRLVATNAAGTTRGRDRSFRTARLARSLTLYSARSTVRWGRGVMLGGRVTGGGVNGMTLALQEQRFPFEAGFTEVGTTRAGADGGYLFSVDNVWTTTNFRVVSRTQKPVVSAPVTVRSAPLAGIAAKLLSRTRARLRVTVRPRVTGELSLQRRRASGGWSQVRHRAMTGGERYTFKVWRARKTSRRYRVVVLPVRGAYVKATSRSVVVAGRRR